MSNLGAPAGHTGILQPKVKWKFLVTTDIAGSLENFTRQISSIDRPKLTMEKVDDVWKCTWLPITVVLRDDVLNIASAFVTQILNDQQNDKKFRLDIAALDGSGQNVIETWSLIDCVISKVSYDEYHYAASDSMTLQLEISYVLAIQTFGEINFDGDLPLI